ncbi:MAG: Transcriptional regulatory protein LiaR [Syntrophorhabdus sp. PtaB.Bin047]|nr:MAG: Transcriptional regulatory protein LiaR [Syntrophorhabdus sp. PtaB.Bin047]
MVEKTLPFDISLNLFKEVFENVPDIAVNVLNRDFTVLWANSVMAAKVDTPLAEMIGKPCYKVWRRRDTPCPVCMLRIVCDTKRPCVMERWLDLPNRERRYAQVRAYPVFDEKGSVKHVFEILIPMDREKKSELGHRRYVESLEEALRKMNASVPSGDTQREPSDPGASLTPRETEVLRLVAQGFSNREIADILLISQDTVKTHLRNVFSKTGATDRTQAAVWAVTNNITYP